MTYVMDYFISKIYIQLLTGFIVGIYAYNLYIDESKTEKVRSDIRGESRENQAKTKICSL